MATHPRPNRPFWLVAILLLGALLASPGVNGQAPQGFGPKAPVPTANEAKLAHRLRKTVAELRSDGITRGNAGARDARGRFSSHAVKVDDSARVQVYIELASADAATLASLAALEVEVELQMPGQPLVQAWVPFDQLDAVAALASVRRVTPPDYAKVSAGAANTAGDTLLRANLVRSSLGVTGTGIRVGVISDGANTRSTAQASGDLPSSITVFGTCSTSGGAICNEGTAMMEIIHDLAPGAALAFGAASTTVEFVQRVTDLRNWGADVIVDDLSFFYEPYFADGSVAQSYASALAAGVVMVSAAGNQGRGHYQSTFVDSDGDKLHNFASGDNKMSFSVPAGWGALVVLQWPERFGTASNDYDLAAYDASGAVVDVSLDYQVGVLSDPMEAVTVSCNSGSPCTFQVAISRPFSATPLPLELMFFYGTATEYNNPADSVYGHAAVPGVIAVGAISAFDPGTDDINNYSSRGPSTVNFPSYQQRATPSLTAVDCVAITGAGGFTSPFCGTSAAAPHAAAVAALMISAKSTLTASAVKLGLENTAVARGVSGYDNTYGAGLIDALAAVGSVLPVPAISTTTPTNVNVGSFTMTINGSGFFPTSAQLVFTGPGCSTNTSCVVPNNVLSTRAAGQLVGPVTLANPGVYTVRIQNWSGGPFSNGATVNVGASTPFVTTSAASGVSQTGATLNAIVNANGTSTTVAFDYGLSTSYTNAVTYGSIGAGTTNVSTPMAIGGLTCGRVYHFRARATNTGGQTLGGDVTFTTQNCPVTAPTVTTNPATGIGQVSATINATVNPNGGTTTIVFDYGTSTGFGGLVSSTTLTGSGAQPVAATVGGLTCGTTYYFRIRATNSAGSATGNTLSFTTTNCSVQAPMVATLAATGVSPTGATLNGTVDPNGGATSTFFDYGTSTSYGSSITGFVLTGSGLHPLSATVSLTCNTTYHFRIRASNSAGSSFGNDMTLTTGNCSDTAAPVVSITSPTSSGSFTAQSSVATIAGTATDAVGVSWVTCRNAATGTTVPANGTTSWSCSVSLASGANAITVSASDAAGNTGSATITANYTSSGSSSQWVNAGTILIPGTAPASTSGPASPYPSTISVSGLNGAVVSVSVTLSGLTHTYPGDVTMLLVGPGGQAFNFMSKVGAWTPVSDLTLVFTDAAPTHVQPDAVLLAGAYKPTAQYGAWQGFPAPAPTSYSAPMGLGTATFSSVFGGTNPNGLWKLFVLDDANGDVGLITNGWQLDLVTAGTTCTYGLNPATSGSLASGGANGSFNVTTQPGCTWSASTAASWIHTSSAGAGSGTVTYGVDTNPGAQRTGTISVAGQQFSVTQATTSVLPQLTSPAPGSTLTSSTVTFQWTGGIGASQYWLYVGTATGYYDLGNRSTGTALSVVVSGLPTDGRTLYVRLLANINGAWQFNDYTVTATTLTTRPAQLTLPAPSSTLASSTVTFQWDGGVGATRYWLYVGNALGTFDIANVDAGASLSTVVNNLPADGRTIYVRLHSLINGAWVPVNATLTATSGGSGGGQLISPAPSSTLTSSTVTFQWTGGVGPTRYWLYVGRTPGAFDLVNQDAGTNLSAVASNLPVDGSALYVRLHSLVNGAWQYLDYTLTAASISQPVPAQLTTPAPGSTLTGSTVTFQWTGGTNVVRYWLYVGTAPGSFDLFNRDMGTQLSTVVSGLPVDGRTVYVRLHSHMGGTWHYIDYTLTAASQAVSQKAQLISPAPGSTLTSSAVTFQWTGGVNVQQYWLYVGTSAGSFDLMNRDMGTQLSTAVTGLPTNGSTIYVRLHSHIGGAWQYNDYTLRATTQSTIQRAQLINPAPNSTVTSSTVTFTWSGGTGVTQYWLQVGRSSGSFDIANVNTVTQLSAVVSGLPGNGQTIYVRLNSLINDVWQYNDYVLTVR
jgi:subtilisin-like proprotein convertase family protein